MRKTCAISVVCFLLGTVSGFLFCNAKSSLLLGPSRPPEFSEEDRLRVCDDEIVKEERPKKSSAIQDKKEKGVTADSQSFLLKELDISPFKANKNGLALSEALCSALSITNSEREKMESMFISVERELTDIQLKNTKLVDSKENLFEFEIGAFEEGSEIRERLYDELLATLGPQRNAMFANIAIDKIYSDFLDFGQEPVKIRVELSVAADSPFYEVHLTTDSGTRYFEGKDIPSIVSHLIEVE